MGQPIVAKMLALSNSNSQRPQRRHCLLPYLLCEAYLPVTWPVPSQPTVGHLKMKRDDTYQHNAPRANRWNSNYSLRKSNTYMYLTSWCSCCCILAAIGHPDKLRTKQEQSWNGKTLALTTKSFHDLHLSDIKTYLLWVAYCPETWPLPSQLGVGQLCTKNTTTRNVNVRWTIFFSDSCSGCWNLSR